MTDLWFKTAVFYEVPVYAFGDSNGDGIGDFAGLTAHLDYLEWLGVDCLWLLPFYASPLQDGGYDISDFRAVLERYGTLDDLDEFLAEAHRRGLRVIGDMIVNHTSDQHAWFREARRPGSPTRDRYVWSETPDVYPDARGTRRPAPTSGTASSTISPISTSTTRTSAPRSETSFGSGWIEDSTGCASTRCPTSMNARARTVRTSPKRTST